MPYFRRTSRLRPINSIKHIVDLQGGVVPDSKTDNVLVSTVDNPDTTVANQCQSGGRINSIFLNVQVVNAADATAVNNAYFIIYKNPGDNIAGASIPKANETGVSDFRKQIFHTEMAMLSDTNDSIPITLFKGVLKIPRHMQRLGINDSIKLQLFTPIGGATLDFCIQCIYKVYR